MFTLHLLGLDIIFFYLSHLLNAYYLLLFVYFYAFKSIFLNLFLYLFSSFSVLLPFSLSDYLSTCLPFCLSLCPSFYLYSKIWFFICMWRFLSEILSCSFWYLLSMWILYHSHDMEQWCPTTFFPSPLCIINCKIWEKLPLTYHCKSIFSEQLPVATFRATVATCGEWRQGWTPLI